ncbi:hypothetical protein TNCV_2505321 [Trichonephila clavipes]|uniref:Uncharacterized protein n=1 Tax=Trichonephila clavipes TaxID=2585209 RepID=A0A8X6WH39_TRICX|nr:hypothetical protein TNCV_2505321 [Trichonephila clavipes]
MDDIKLMLTKFIMTKSEITSVISRNLEHRTGDSTFRLRSTSILRENTLRVGQEASHLSFLAINLSKGLLVRRLFRMPMPHRLYTFTHIHAFSELQPRPYGPAVSINNPSTL